MDIWDIRHFLYEIDSVLSDEQIFQLADEIFNNQEIKLPNDDLSNLKIFFIYQFAFTYSSCLFTGK